MSVEEFEALQDIAPAEALRDAGVDLILFSCSAGSMNGDPGFNQEMSARLSEVAGVPAATTTISALQALGVRRFRPHNTDGTVGARGGGRLQLAFDFLCRSSGMSF
ncbi:hypothetical protein OCL88_19960 [Paenarthrobacter sp. PAE-2]|uniref:hypothetical protein n=1 Tax=Paenarthrobacter sp. PAE-2 TaxID=2982532 RepID=UPI0022309274|nr:hypothetical protein [Paenarthrobacter sp. PAE-2]MCW3768752.1 hypothetical protein [Paenarthrobacter sp. PAE-2]